MREPATLLGGSSPRVRGKADGVAAGPCVAGIIPAGAGKSLIAKNLVILVRDHPRGCGEKIIEAEGVLRQKGSSPRVRGKATPPSSKSSTPRIIPAGAGKRTTMAETSRHT